MGATVALDKNNAISPLTILGLNVNPLHFKLTSLHDFSEVTPDLQQSRADESQFLHICFCVRFAREKARQEKPAQGEIMVGTEGAWVPPGPFWLFWIF